MVGLVTGANGFLGQAIARRLEAEGWVVARAGRPEVELPSDAFSRVLVESAPSLVVHCAGPASVANSVDDPRADRRGSVGVLTTMLGELRGLASPPRLLLLSSAAVYGQPTVLPVAETARLRPMSPYGAHRAECEELVAASGLPFAVLRVFSAYGAGLRRQLLWDICLKALARAEILALFGSGDETRDFVHADDVAAAVAVVARDRGTPAFLNVASGSETTVRTVAERLLAQLPGDPGRLRFTSGVRPGDPSRWCADVTRLHDLGWSPRVSLDSGLREYARWAQEDLAGAQQLASAGPSGAE